MNDEIEISQQFKDEWLELLTELQAHCLPDSGELEVTIAVDETVSNWNYQTGDNSFTGACYSFPHWGVIWINSDSDLDSEIVYVTDQLEDLLNSQ